MNVKEIINKYEKKDESILGILEDIQTEFGYISQENLKTVADEFGIKINRLFSLASFYKSFSLKPKGKHIILVCMGTACHVRGAPKLVDKLQQLLKVKPGDTTDDGFFTLETVNCLGACALGPLVVIDGKYYASVGSSKIEKILDSYKR